MQDIKTQLDEKGTGGFWDFAGEVAQEWAILNGKVWPDERLQELIYNSVKYELLKEE